MPRGFQEDGFPLVIGLPAKAVGRMRGVDLVVIKHMHHFISLGGISFLGINEHTTGKSAKGENDIVSPGSTELKNFQVRFNPVNAIGA